jgi:hypothetical protein
MVRVSHRIGQKFHVNVYQFVSKDTVEEHILERAKKMVLEYASTFLLHHGRPWRLMFYSVVHQMDTGPSWFQR